MFHLCMFASSHSDGSSQYPLQALLPHFPLKRWLCFSNSFSSHSVYSPWMLPVISTVIYMLVTPDSTSPAQKSHLYNHSLYSPASWLLLLEISQVSPTHRPELKRIMFSSSSSFSVSAFSSQWMAANHPRQHLIWSDSLPNLQPLKLKS